jgi:hypothetical protein
MAEGAGIVFEEKNVWVYRRIDRTVYRAHPNVALLIRLTLHMPILDALEEDCRL